MIFKHFRDDSHFTRKSAVEKKANNEHLLSGLLPRREEIGMFLGGVGAAAYCLNLDNDIPAFSGGGIILGAVGVGLIFNGMQRKSIDKAVNGIKADYMPLNHEQALDGQQIFFDEQLAQIAKMFDE